MKRFLFSGFLFCVSLCFVQAQSPGKEVERLQKAAEVFKQVMDTPDKTIPKDLVNRCACIAVIPSMKKAGFVLGGRYGKGVVSCRRAQGTGSWGPPSMIMLTGGSFGLQIGGAAIDVIMLVMNPNGIKDLLKDKFTLGGDASVAAGPVGRAGTAETDALMHAKILTYSRSRGAFAGLELKGAVVKQDGGGNRNLYGRDVSVEELLIDGKASIPGAASPFIQTLAKYSPARSKKPL